MYRVLVSACHCTGNRTCACTSTCVCTMYVYVCILTVSILYVWRTALIRARGNRDILLIRTACALPDIRMVYSFTSKMKTPLYWDPFLSSGYL